MKLEIISKYPSGKTNPTPLLFVHGTFFTASCWQVYFLDYFAQHGLAAHALNLRGHGNSEGPENLRWTRISDYVEDLGDAVRQLPGPPVLIGHSMGGFIVQKYLEHQSAPGAVLLSAPGPAGMLPTALRNARRHPLIFARVSLTLNLLPLVATPRLAREAFFSDALAEEQLVEYWKQMQHDSFMAFADMVALDLPKPGKIKTPLLVLGVERDNMIAPSEIQATARAYHTRAEIIPALPHNSMLEQGWQNVAERILRWLEKQQLQNPTVHV